MSAIVIQVPVEVLTEIELNPIVQVIQVVAEVLIDNSGPEPSPSEGIFFATFI